MIDKILMFSTVLEPKNAALIPKAPNKGLKRTPLFKAMGVRLVECFCLCYLLNDPKKE